MGLLLEQEVHLVKDVETMSDFELKHSPCIEIEELASGRLAKVSIGLKGIVHPQSDEHLIEWIRVIVGEDLVGEVTFGGLDVPVAEYEIAAEGVIVAQASCNLHGVWQSIWV